MASGISISIASETREYAQGIQRGVIEPTQDAADALEKMQHAGAGDELERGMRDAQRATGETRADIQRLRLEVQEAGRAGASGGGKFKAGMHEASEGVKDLRQNTASNLKEVAASFDGTTQSSVQGVQGLVAEMLEGFGPAGLVAGAVAAGGIGLLLSGIEADATATEAFKTDVQALAATWIEAGRDGKLGVQDIADGLKSLATQTDSQKASLADVAKQAKTLGIPFKELAQVYVEGGDATNYALQKTQQLIDAQRAGIEVSRAGARAGVGPTIGRENAARTEAIAKLEAQRQKLLGVQRETTEAAKREREWLAAGGPDLEAKASATEAYGAAVQSAVHDAGASWDDYKDKEGGLSLAKYLKVTRDKIKATQEYQANIAQVAASGNQDALNYVESLGTDAAPLLEQFVHAPERKKAELVAVWAQLGKQSTDAYKAAVEDNMLPSVPAPALLPPDTSGYESAVRTAQARAQAYLNAHPLKADAIAYDARGKPIYQ